jgi:hypothetical protein
VSGILRWGARVQAYFFSLTDEFPPFNLQPEAGPGGSSSYAISAVVGVALIVLAIGGLTTAAIFGSQREDVTLDYQVLLAGDVPAEETALKVHSGRFLMIDALDPADEAYPFLTLEDEEDEDEDQEERRLVAFTITVDHYRADNEVIGVDESKISLKDTGGDRHDPALLVVNGKAGDRDIEHDDDTAVDGTVLVVFAVPTAEDPAELEWNVIDFIPGVGETVVWEFE